MQSNSISSEAYLGRDCYLGLFLGLSYNNLGFLFNIMILLLLLWLTVLMHKCLRDIGCTLLNINTLWLLV